VVPGVGLGLGDWPRIVIEALALAEALFLSVATTRMVSDDAECPSFRYIAPLQLALASETVSVPWSAS
jgi:hypothetical protein